jgi:steroid delta-isomerase
VAARIALFADDALFEDPIGSPPIRGREALAGFFAETVASGIAIELTSERIVVGGDEALSITDARWGFPGTDPARVEIFQIFAFDAQGRIASLRIFMDESCLK